MTELLWLCTPSFAFLQGVFVGWVLLILLGALVALWGLTRGE